MDSPNIKALEALITGPKVSKTLIYKGGTEGNCLYWGGDAAVQRAFLKAGTVFEEHSHKSTEVVVVLSGVFHSRSAYITAVTPVAGVVVFQPGIPHSHLAETDCWVIGVLIPSDDGYPHD